MLVGAFAKLGPGELRAAWSKLDDRTAANVDRKLAAAGYDHPLAKQTLVYGTVVRDKTRGDDAANGFEFGLRHSFCFRKRLGPPLRTTAGLFPSSDSEHHKPRH
jgi:hypothetical protein